MGRKGDLCDFEQGRDVSEERAGPSISGTADLLEFSQTTGSRVYRVRSEKEISSECLSIVWTKMPAVRGE